MEAGRRFHVARIADNLRDDLRSVVDLYDSRRLLWIIRITV